MKTNYVSSPLGVETNELPNCGNCGQPPQAMAPPPAQVWCVVRGGLSFLSVYPQPQPGTPPCSGFHRLWLLSPVPCGDAWGEGHQKSTAISWQDHHSTERGWTQPSRRGSGYWQSSLLPGGQHPRCPQELIPSLADSCHLRPQGTPTVSVCSTASGANPGSHGGDSGL